MKKIFLIFLFLVSFVFLLKAQVVSAPIFCKLTVQDSVVDLYWQVIDTSSIDGFIIKRLILDGDSVVYGTFNNVAILNGINITHYIDTSTAYNTRSKPYERSESYRIASYKIINDSMYYGISPDVHKSIFLSSEFDTCNKKIILRWTKYQGREVYQYNVKSKLEGQNQWQFIRATTDTFLVFSLESNKHYYFVVEAVLMSNSFCSPDSSVSNIVSVYSKSSVFPDTLYIWQVNFIDNHQVSLDFVYSDGHMIREYCLLNGVDTLKKWSTNDELYSYTVDWQSGDCYRIVAIDSCKKAKSSNVVCPVFLRVKQQDNKLFFQWNSYNSFSNPLAYYKVYYRDSLIEWEEIAQLQDTTLVLPISQVIKDFNLNKVYFYVSAVEDGINQYGKQGISNSNVVQLELSPLISVPNAVNPKSQIFENRYFIPKIYFAQKVEVAIFNSEGFMVFKSTDNHKFWDGRYKGKLQPQGYYTYVIKVWSTDGEIYQKKGFLYLIYK